ncbi:MAG: hypothetical protein V3V08_20135 [Nannocystaceae bacterium]
MLDSFLSALPRKTFILSSLLLVPVACGPTTKSVGEDAAGTSGESSAGLVDSGTGTDAEGPQNDSISSSAGGDTGDGSPDPTQDSGSDVDCANLPDPVVRPLEGNITASAAIAFDAEGHLVGSDEWDIYRSRYDGTRELYLAIQQRAGLEYLTTGDLVVADELESSFTLVRADGSQATLLSGLRTAYGTAADLEGHIYVTDHNQIYRVNPETGETISVLPEAYEVSDAFWEWLDQAENEENVGEPPDVGDAVGPRVITFDRDYASLLIGSAFSDWIYRLPLGQDGRGGTPVKWGRIPVGASQMPANGRFIDGVGVDVCGNVYVADYETSALYRIPPEGGEGVLLVQWNDETYGHGIAWGSGIDGWDERAIYLPQPYNSAAVVEVQIGVPSKRRAFP